MIIAKNVTIITIDNKFMNDRNNNVGRGVSNMAARSKKANSKLFAFFMDG